MQLMPFFCFVGCPITVRVLRLLYTTSFGWKASYSTYVIGGCVNVHNTQIGQSRLRARYAWYRINEFLFVWDVNYVVCKRTQMEALIFFFFCGGKCV